MGSVSDRIESIPEAVPLQDREALGRGVRVAERVVQNARQAARYWSLWEAINNRLEPSKPLRKALEWFQPEGFVAVRESLALGAILAALRVTEDPSRSEDRMSACVLAGLLSNPSVVTILVSKEWVSNPGDELACLEIDEQKSRIIWLTNNVPFGWGKAVPPPVEGNLPVIRQRLRSVRNDVIAHSLDKQAQQVSIDDVREGVRGAVGIAKCCSLVFLGHTSGLDEPAGDAVARVDRFWECFEHGVVSMHSIWHAEAKSLGAPS